MAKVSIYLNFPGDTEEAFNFYKLIFKTEWTAPIMRMSTLPPQEGIPPLSEEDQRKVMHVALPTLAGV